MYMHGRPIPVYLCSNVIVVQEATFIVYALLIVQVPDKSSVTALIENYAQDGKVVFILATSGKKKFLYLMQYTLVCCAYISMST